MRILRWLLLSVLLMALLVAGLLGFTLYTQTGLRWTLAAVEASLPGALTIDGIKGRLAGPLTLTNLRYRDASVEVNASRLVFDWSPGKLLDRELHIALLQAERVDVLTTAAPDETPRPATEPITLPDVRLPLGIRIVEATLDELTVRNIDAAQPFSVVELRTALSFDGQTLTVQRLEGETTGISLSVDGQLTPTGSYPLLLTGQYSRQSGTPPDRPSDPDTGEQPAGRDPDCSAGQTRLGRPPAGAAIRHRNHKPRLGTIDHGRLRA
jgi:translocation and assembly module TamB